MLQVAIEGVANGVSVSISRHPEWVAVNALSIDAGDKVEPRGPLDQGPVEALVCDHGPSIGYRKLTLTFIVSHRSGGGGSGFVSAHNML